MEFELRIVVEKVAISTQTRIEWQLTNDLG